MLYKRVMLKEMGVISPILNNIYIKPLSTDNLVMLIGFVSKMAENEVAQSRATRTNFIAIGSAIISAAAAITAVLLKHD